MLKSRLKVILAERNIKQQDLLKRMKKPISHGAMSKIVNGTIPKLETAADIAKALDMHIDEIWILE
jgi:transcriptional regulator with XRE-family HTH domain